MTAKQIIERIEEFRRDAEMTERNNVSGIDMLRSWLRSLHMEVAFKGDIQEATQDEFAKQLGEHHRGHAREFKKI